MMSFPTMKRWQLKFAIIFGVWTALGLLWAVNAYYLRVEIGAPAPMSWILRRSLGEHWVWAFLTPVVFWFAERYPFSRRGWLRVLLLHLGFFVLLSMAHVTISHLLNVPMAYGSRRLPDQTWVMRFNLEFYPDLWNFWPLVCFQNLLSYYKKYRDRELRSSRLQTELARAQLEVLRAQLQPHFLFNTLNSISALMREDVEAADAVLVDLSHMLRASLQNNEKQVITLREELDLLEAYLRIQHKRFEDRLETHIHADPETLEAGVPTLFLQPLVENAIAHGIAPLARRGTVEVLTSRSGDRLTVRVADNGRGLTEGYQERIGLGNTRQRLRQLYADDHSLTIESEPDKGVIITISLPFQKIREDISDSESDLNSDRGGGRRAAGTPAHPVAAQG